MSQTLTSFFAQPFKPAANAVFKATVAGIPYTITVSSAYWYRLYLASSAAGGATHADPKEFLAYLKGLLDAATGAVWTFRMRTDGRVEFSSSVGIWSIQWDGAGGTDVVVRNLLGFVGNGSALNGGQYFTATYQPTHCLLSSSRTNDNGWVIEPPDSAWGTLPTGHVYSFSSGYSPRCREFDLEHHPYTYGAVAASENPSTPIEGDRSRWLQASGVPAVTLTPPWSCLDFLMTCRGRELGAALGDFQSHVANTVTNYDACYFDPGSLKRALVQLQIKDYSETRRLSGLAFSYVSQKVRS